MVQLRSTLPVGALALLIFISGIVPYSSSCGDVLPALVADMLLPLESYYETIQRTEMFTFFPARQHLSESWSDILAEGSGMLLPIPQRRGQSLLRLLQGAEGAHPYDLFLT